MQLSRINSRSCQQRRYQIFKTSSSSTLRISKTCEGVRSERDYHQCWDDKTVLRSAHLRRHVHDFERRFESQQYSTQHSNFCQVNKTIVFAVHGFRTCQNLIQWKDGWHGRSTLLPWWPLLQTWACPYMSLSSSMSTGDRDLFLGPLEWARAETGGVDRWVLKRRGFPGVARVYLPPCPWDTHISFQ